MSVWEMTAAWLMGLVTFGAGVWAGVTLTRRVTAPAPAPATWTTPMGTVQAVPVVQTGDLGARIPSLTPAQAAYQAETFGKADPITAACIAEARGNTQVLDRLLEQAQGMRQTGASESDILAAIRTGEREDA